MKSMFAVPRFVFMMAGFLISAVCHANSWQVDSVIELTTSLQMSEKGDNKKLRTAAKGTLVRIDYTSADADTQTTDYVVTILSVAPDVKSENGSDSVEWDKQYSLSVDTLDKSDARYVSGPGKTKEVVAKSRRFKDTEIVQLTADVPAFRKKGDGDKAWQAAANTRLKVVGVTASAEQYHVVPDGSIPSSPSIDSADLVQEGVTYEVAKSSLEAAAKIVTGGRSFEPPKPVESASLRAAREILT